MCRDQISLEDAKGKQLGNCFVSKDGSQLFMAIGEREFVLIEAARQYDAEAVIDLDFSGLAFRRKDWRMEDLATVFPADWIAGLIKQDAEAKASSDRRIEESKRVWLEQRQAAKRIRLRCGE